MGEWVAHDGGACPVAHGTKCEIRFRDGSICECTGRSDWDDAVWRNVSDVPRGDDVIAYRVIEPEQQAHAMSHPAINSSCQGMLDNSIDKKERKHVSDAAWEQMKSRLNWRDLAREDCETIYRKAGTVLLTVAEHDALLAHQRRNVDYSAAQEITSLELQCTRALAERDVLRAEVNEWKEICASLDAQLRDTNAKFGIGTKTGAGNESNHGVDRERIGGCDGVDAGIRAASRCDLLACADTLNPRLGMPQPGGEPVEPMSARKAYQWGPV